MENENKELMRLSLKLRTFSTHATVMYAKGTDYSILEVRLSSHCHVKPTFSCCFVTFPYQRSIKTKNNNQKMSLPPSRERLQRRAPTLLTAPEIHFLKQFHMRDSGNVAAV